MTYNLNIGLLYPDLMSAYGDRGNILVLKKRCEWRKIKVKIIPIDQKTENQKLKTINLLFGGGSQDREQEIVMRDLRGKKQETLKQLIENNIPALFVCGSPQLMGKYYEPAVGKRIEGLGIFDMVTENPGSNIPRCIGNIVVKVQLNMHNCHPELGSGSPTDEKGMLKLVQHDNIIVGFENHGGRTYLGKTAKPFAKVIKGCGNNGKDGTEGVVYKNAIGSYLHGPLLPKNPQIADFLIQRALEIKYEEKVELQKLDDSLENSAHHAIVKRLGIKL